MDIHWGDVATWTSAAMLLLTLVVLWWQIRDVRHSVQGATYERISATMINIDKFFVDNPGLRPFFYGGKTLEGVDDEKREKLYATAEMLTDFFYDVFHQKDLMPQPTFESYSSWIKLVYSKSPVLREFVPTGTYDEAFVRHLKGEPSPEKPKHWWQFWKEARQKEVQRIDKISELISVITKHTELLARRGSSPPSSPPVPPNEPP
jgi:hypothetical protein